MDYELYYKIREDALERRDFVGDILPANWISIKGNFSPSELRVIADRVEENFNKISVKHGNKE